MMPDPPDWKTKYKYREATGSKRCSTCSAFMLGKCEMFNDEVAKDYTCTEWSKTWHKQSMAMTPEMWQKALQQTPYFYHVTEPNRVSWLKKHGIVPGSEVAEQTEQVWQPVGGLPARAGCVYLFVHEQDALAGAEWFLGSPSADPVIIHIDAKQLDPSLIEVDEDYFGSDSRGVVETFGGPTPPEFYGDTEGTDWSGYDPWEVANEPGSDWSIQHPKLGDPAATWGSYQENRTVAYRGSIPVSAIVRIERMSEMSDRGVESWDVRGRGFNTGGDWQKESSEDDEDWVPIIGSGDEVIRGKPLDEGGNLFQYVPEPQDYSLDEALTDLRDGGYRWQIQQGDQPDMWRFQHKREADKTHDISSRDLQLRGYNIYYNDDYLPRAGTAQGYNSGHFSLHDTTSEQPFSRIWATQRADVEGWQRPEPGALNEPHLREKAPDLWRRHWGEQEHKSRAIMSVDAGREEAHSEAQGGDPEDAEQASSSVPEAQGQVAYWPSWEDVDELSHGAVDNHQGYRDIGLIEGAIGSTQMAQQYGGYEDIFATAAELFSKIQRQQAIIDGNKRTAAVVMLHFLEQNGHDTGPLTGTEPLEDEFVSILLHVAEGADSGQLARFLRQHTVPYLHTAARAVGIPFETLAKITLQGQWSDIMAKAKRLIMENKVTLLVNTPNAIVAHVVGDGTDNNGTPDEHEVEIARDDPDSNVITQSNCDCAWNQYRWDRTRSWKKFEGRVCSHILATFWKSKSTPIDVTGLEPGTEYKAPVGQRGPVAPPGQLQIPVPKPAPVPQEPIQEGQATPQPTAPPLPSTGDMTVGPQPQNPFAPPKKPGPGQPNVPQREQLDLFTLPPATTPPAGGFSQPGQTPPDPTAGPQLPGAFSKWYNRTAMAERSGDPELDALVEEFIAGENMRNGGDVVQRLRDPQQAWAGCIDWSESFVGFLHLRGIEAKVVVIPQQPDTSVYYGDHDPGLDGNAEWHPAPEGTTLDSLGYGEGDFAQHAMVSLSFNGHDYLVDWTATQYGEQTEVPQIFRQDQGWQRKWEVRQSMAPMTISGYHNSADGPLQGPYAKRDLYISGVEGPWWGSGPVYRVTFEARNPLIISTGRQMQELWAQAGQGEDSENFHPEKSGRFCDMARAMGYDAIIVEPSAVAATDISDDQPYVREVPEWQEPDVDDEELAYQWGAGTWGDPQTIILEPERAAFEPISPQQKGAGVDDPDEPLEHAWTDEERQRFLDQKAVHDERTTDPRISWTPDMDYVKVVRNTYERLLRDDPRDQICSREQINIGHPPETAISKRRSWLEGLEYNLFRQTPGLTAAEQGLDDLQATFRTDFGGPFKYDDDGAFIGRERYQAGLRAENGF